ncbi:MFS transporter [Paracoccus sp. SY]|uniref:MFS transporter n=1 Tax=Paracoccus sp. SY TaxID=1330255 RepID=UPI000CD1C269|nr:MFS transporter [Paracoccus sp. SY]
MTVPRTGPVVAALGTAQTIAWASSYYLPAVLAVPMARDLGLSPAWVFAGFTLAMVISALIGPWGGTVIDRQGGRRVLPMTNLVFAAGLLALAGAQGPTTMLMAWAMIGLGMGTGLYDAAFATLAGMYGKAARSPITGITLIAGFASTIGWPLSGLIESWGGWRVACLVWAGLHLALALPLNLCLPRHQGARQAETASQPSETTVPRLSMYLLAFVFTATWFTSTAMAAHLPRLLEAAGATTAMAIAAGALIGPAQVGARLLEFGLLKRFHPLVSARIAALAHPAGAVALAAFGGPAAYAFALSHGAGNGVLTIAKGTLPLALFGPDGYGLRQGLLSAPARLVQAGAPLIFGVALDLWGTGALWLTAGISGFACVALLILRSQPT